MTVRRHRGAWGPRKATTPGDNWPGLNLPRRGRDGRFASVGWKTHWNGSHDWIRAVDILSDSAVECPDKAVRNNRIPLPDPAIGSCPEVIISRNYEHVDGERVAELIDRLPTHSGSPEEFANLFLYAAAADERATKLRATAGRERIDALMVGIQCQGLCDEGVGIRLKNVFCGDTVG